MKINWWPFALIFYTDNLPEDPAVPPTWRLAGCASNFIVRIRPEYRGDEGLLAHELVHIGQGWKLLMIGHSLLYRFSAKYRLWAEVSAYKVQMLHPNGRGNLSRDTGEFSREYLSVERAARHLMSPRYKFNLTFEEAKSLLE